MQPTELTFSSLISIEGNQWHYHIPRFQRGYVWGKMNWSKLLEDIYDNEPGHYMGSIICVHQDEELSPQNELVYEMVDGQQRLTTLSLLLAAIYKRLDDIAKNNLEIATDRGFIIRIDAVEKRLIKKITNPPRNLPIGFFKSNSLTYCLRVQPSTQDSNLDDYQYILKEAGILPNGSNPSYVRVRRLYKGYKYFYDHIPDNLNELNELLDRISALSFIHISESSQTKAFMLFETLNYRGVPLSAIDIIKNKMLATLESQHALSLDEAYDQWQHLLSFLPEDRNQNRFLRQFYNAFNFKEEIKVEKINRATSSKIISVYETLIKRDAETIFLELLDKAEQYNQLLEPENYGETQLSMSLAELARIGAAPSYTFLLYLLSLQEDDFQESDIISNTVQLLCKYYFRRNVTDFPGTRNLDAINIELVDKCQSEIEQGKQISFSFIQNIVLSGNSKPASVENFRNILSDNFFDNNESMARFALIKLDEMYHSREYQPNLWQRNEKGIYIWTVEHVFPQGDNIPPEWVEMITDGTPGDKAEEARKIHNELVHCFGNLTLSGYNSKLSNKGFEIKQNKSELTISGQKIQIGYKNGLGLNNIQYTLGDEAYTLATAEKWTPDHIKARNNVMVNLLVDLFKFENES